MKLDELYSSLTIKTGAKLALIVLDGLGIGALPDADQYGDSGSNTLGHVGAAVRLAVMLSAKSRFHHDAAEALFWCARAVVGGSREARILYPRLRRAGREGRRRD